MQGVGVRLNKLSTEAFPRNVFGLDTYQVLGTMTLKYLTVSERFATGGMFSIFSNISLEME